jgi:hypothetical protein
MINTKTQTTFFKKLFESISSADDTKSNIHNSQKSNVCLISGEVLDNTKVTLICNHSFNYTHIFKEIFMQKYKPSITEIQKLKRHQIKCPYCRNIQDYLIPPLEGFKNTLYINYPLNMVMTNNTCSYKFNRGKRKNLECAKPCINEYCIQHTKIMRARNTKMENTTPVILCDSIIKSGKRKGETCGNKAKYSNKCGKHKIVI